MLIKYDLTPGNGMQSFIQSCHKSVNNSRFLKRYLFFKTITQYPFAAPMFKWQAAGLCNKDDVKSINNEVSQ